MPEKKLNVRLLQRTDNALEVIYSACRQCYSSDCAAEIYEGSVQEGDIEKLRRFIRKILRSGHESPLEHVSFTFSVEGVSRALTHQLVRHRLASYSQQSQRYVKAENFDFIVPPSIAKDSEANEEFLNILQNIQASYDKLLGILKKNSIEGEKANQDARFVLPQAAETKIVITMNARELKHFFALRCCVRAQWEIRALADRMLNICIAELPDIFKEMGAKCETLGYCPEDKSFTCGRYPVRSV